MKFSVSFVVFHAIRDVYSLDPNQVKANNQLVSNLLNKCNCKAIL